MLRLATDLTLCDGTRMEELLTTAELAARLGVSPSAISRRVAAGTLKPVRKMPGKRGAFLFDASQIEQAVAS